MNTHLFPDTWQLIMNCLRCIDQSKLRITNKFLNTLKYKTISINIIPKTFKDHIYI